MCLVPVRKIATGTKILVEKDKVEEFCQQYGCEIIDENKSTDDKSSKKLIKKTVSKKGKK